MKAITSMTPRGMIETKELYLNDLLHTRSRMDPEMVNGRMHNTSG